ncbi:UbiD family decarboxylase [Tumebacillus permanentifrigoris]|uniref:UbiD family decarboxylase n=1 Tax=Tumebacillus permanentifrigoris TaxID=378543 RepID=A0A316D9M8_9BACL|nr:UbiD family decarboxylase [Tumebacillus permanentifrigoris]PWK08438.1 UbiD family decarboxylase [Tumebacillus permanentifrigoris]
MHRNLRSFINTLRQERDIVEITAEVDPNLELAEIHRRVIAEGGPALLFTNVKGSSYPVFSNMFGTIRRVDLAFGPRPEQLMKEIISLTHKLVPPTLGKLWGERNLFLELAKVGTKNVGRDKAPILDLVDSPAKLSELPVLTSWHEDGGPFVTLPLVYTEHPDPNKKDHNLGMYRVQVYDDNTTGMHWQIQKGGGFHHWEAEQRGEDLATTVFLGGPPALIASAIAPVPEMLPELLLTSLILGEKLPVIADPAGGRNPLIAEAEFAIVGKVPPHQRRLEGPFGDHFGYYSLAHEFPVFNVDRVYHRRDAIYPATVVGKPVQEDYYLGDFLQRLLSPAFPLAMPGVRELWTYAETGFHALAAAVVRESYKRETIAHAFRILGEGQLSLTKFLILADKMVDLTNFAATFEQVLERFDPATDLFVIGNTSNDTLDYTGRQFNKGSKGILLGTGDPIRTLPGQYQGPDLALVNQIEPYCKGCLCISGASYEQDPELGARIVQQHADALREWPVVFLVDDAKVAKAQSSFLWTTFTRFDPSHDIYAEADLVRHHVAYKLPIVIDARMKPWYPDEVETRPDIDQKVSARWTEYFGKQQF